MSRQLGLPTDTQNRVQADFERKAAAAIAAHIPLVENRVRAHALPAGKWHPYGFAVFHLTEIEGLGKLRLHFWPRDLRRVLPGSPQVHCHSWRLYSTVLAGVYRDMRYDVNILPAAEHSKPGARAHTPYAIEYGRDGAPDSFVTFGDLVSVRPLTRATRESVGTVHTMKPGQFHASPVPRTSFCATLLIMSPDVQGFNNVFVGNSKFGLKQHTRPKIEPHEVDLMCSQFIAATQPRQRISLSPPSRISGLT